jgi:hypothetical protein
MIQAFLAAVERLIIPLMPDRFSQSKLAVLAIPEAQIAASTAQKSVH